jgi:hypothetical protein
MPSNIDFTKPIYGHPTTQSVRDNFAIASEEITDLQAFVSDGPFLPLDGGVRMTDFFELYNHPRSNFEPATKQYVDEIAFNAVGTIPDAPQTDLGLFYARGGGSVTPNVLNDWSPDPLFVGLKIGSSKTDIRFNIRSDATHNIYDLANDSLNLLRFDRTNKIAEFMVNGNIIAGISDGAITLNRPTAIDGVTTINGIQQWGSYSVSLIVGNTSVRYPAFMFTNDNLTTPSFALLRYNAGLWISSGTPTEWKKDLAFFTDTLFTIFTDVSITSGLNVSRDSMFGQAVTLNTEPTTNKHATTKLYVDTTVNNKAANYLPLIGGVMTGGIVFADSTDLSNSDSSKHILLHSSGHGFGITTNRLNYNVPGDLSSHVFLWNAVDKVYINGTGITLAPGAFVTLSADPVNLSDATNKNYVDIGDANNWLNFANYLPLAGGIMTGGIIFNSSASSLTDLSKHISLNVLGTAGFNTQYGGINYIGGFHIFSTSAGVTSVQISNSGINMYTNTTISLAADPTADFHASTKHYVDIQDAALKSYVDTQDNAIWANFANYLPLAGGTVFGEVLFNAPSFNAVRIGGLAGAYRLIGYETNGFTRFRVGLDNTAEDGTGIGSNYVIANYDDAGISKGTVLGIDRHTGLMTLNNGLIVNNKLTTNNGLRFTPQVAPNNAPNDFTYHLDMYGGQYGLSITGGTLNVVAGGTIALSPAGGISGGFNHAMFNSTGLIMAIGTYVTLGNPPTANEHATNKYYVDQEMSRYLPLTGGTLTGELVIDPQVFDAWGQYVMGLRLGAVNPAGLLFSSSDPTAQAIGLLRWGDKLYISSGTIDAWQSDIANFSAAGVSFKTATYIEGLFNAYQDAKFWGKVTINFPPTADMEVTNKLYVDAVDDFLQSQISILAQDLYFVGGINVVIDQGNYTLVVTNPPEDAPYPPYPDLSPLPAARLEYKGFFVIVTQGGTSPDPAVIPTNIPYDNYALNDWLVCDGQAWYHLGIGQANLVASNVAISPPIGALGPNVQTGLTWLDTNKVRKDGDTLTGFLTLHSDPQNGNHASTKSYVDARAFQEAPSNNVMYGRKNAAWHQVGDLISVPAGAFDPTIGIPQGFIGAYQITNQTNALGWPADNWSQTAYILVGFNSNGGWTNKLMMGGYRHTDGLMMPLWYATNDNAWELVLTGAGGKMNANAQFILGKDPVNAMDATTKGYTDRQDALYLPLTGGTINGPLTVNGPLGINGLADFWQAVAIHGQFSFNNQMSATPPAELGGGYFGWNFSQANGEVAFFNAYTPAAPSFAWHQLTAPGVSAKIADLTWQRLSLPAGWGITYGGLPNGGSLIGWTWDGRVQAYVDGTWVITVASVADLANYLPLAGGVMTGGISFGTRTGIVNSDVSQHLALWSSSIGIGITGARMNLVTDTNTGIFAVCGETDIASFSNASGLTMYNGRTVTLGTDPTTAMHAVTKSYDDRNRARGLVDISLNTASPTVGDVDWTYIYIYGSPTATAEIIMPVATSVRVLWTMNNTTAQWVVIKGLPEGGTVSIAPGASQAVWTDTSGIYPLYNAGATRPMWERSTFWATTEFVSAQDSYYMPLSGGNFTGGIKFNGAVVDLNNDLTRHIELFPGYGFNITSSRLNVTTGSQIYMVAGATDIAAFNAGGLQMFAPMYLVHDPVSALEAVTKQYVDVAIGGVNGNFGNYLPLWGGSLSGPLFITAVPNDAQAQLEICPPAGTLGLESKIRFRGTFAVTGGTDLNSRFVSSIRSGYAPETAWGGEYLDIWTGIGQNDANLDSAQVQVARFNQHGITLKRGQITLVGNPVNPLEAATKQYIDGSLGWYLPLSGGILTGGLYLNNSLGISYDAGNFVKFVWMGSYTDIYIDNQRIGTLALQETLNGYLPLSGGTINGALTINGSGSDPLLLSCQPGNFSRIFTEVVGVRKWSAGVRPDGWFTIGDEYVPTYRMAIDPSGNSYFYGPVILAADPINPLDAATKQYVDAHAGTIAGYLPLTGGTISPGPLSILGQLHARDYVTFDWTVGIGCATQPAQLIFASPNGMDNSISGSRWEGSGGTGHNLRWQILFGDNALETDVDGVGNNFRLTAHRNNGTIAFTPLYIQRSNGVLHTHHLLATRHGGDAFIGSYDSDPAGPSIAGMWNAKGILNFGVCDLNGTITSSVANINTLTGICTFTKIYAWDQIVFTTSMTNIYCDVNYTHMTMDSGNWAIRYTRVDGTLQWIRGSDGAPLFTASPVGNFTIAHDLYINNGAQGIYIGGSGLVIQCSPSWYFDWNATDGSLYWTTPSGGMIIDRTSDWLHYNNFGAMAGHGAYWDLSDERTKTDVFLATIGLEEILQLNPIRFRRIKSFKQGPKTDDYEDIGFSAQQVKGIIPQAVRNIGMELPDGNGGLDSDNPTLGLATTPIVVALVNSVKTLSAMVTKLTERIAVLEGEQHA